ncbi:hypothetical protein CPB83DRAFT_841330 [Crepidotus variabilis]|uniref:Uncharacterized protein n=1 Tax=Crepidotus variabilis TaxID=179855 RepID=A0A9P6BC60_9AGAR|nr:hypothetical protein CPB83DRAFT_841330 [Crepidotus variabilis]
MSKRNLLPELTLEDFLKLELVPIPPSIHPLFDENAMDVDERKLATNDKNSYRQDVLGVESSVIPITSFSREEPSTLVLRRQKSIHNYRSEGTRTRRSGGSSRSSPVSESGSDKLMPFGMGPSLSRSTSDNGSSVSSASALLSASVVTDADKKEYIEIVIKSGVYDPSNAPKEMEIPWVSLLPKILTIDVTEKRRPALAQLLTAQNMFFSQIIHEANKLVGREFIDPFMKSVKEDHPGITEADSSTYLGNQIDLLLFSSVHPFTSVSSSSSARHAVMGNLPSPFDHLIVLDLLEFITSTASFHPNIANLGSSFSRELISFCFAIRPTEAAFKKKSVSIGIISIKSMAFFYLKLLTPVRMRSTKDGITFFLILSFCNSKLLDERCDNLNGHSSAWPIKHGGVTRRVKQRETVVE